jgi:hypothetical protein
MIEDQRVLFAFGRFAHDPQSILAAVYGLALVGIELGLHIGTRELGIATFAHTDGREVSLYDSQIALRHDCSLAHLVGGI